MDELDRLYEAVETISDIRCTNCGTSQTMYCISDYEAAEAFQSEGWRATHYNVYCPTCAKQKLKPKK